MAGIRQARGDVLCAYLALHPVHGDYAELGWLADPSIGPSDADCIAFGVTFARECGLRYLIAEPTTTDREQALRDHFFSGTGLLVRVL